MPFPALPLVADQAPGLEELGGAPQLAVNLLTEKGTGALYLRPGISPWTDFPAPPANSPVIGMAEWRGSLIYVTQDRRVWRWQGPGVVVPLSTAAPATLLPGTLRPTFACTRAHLLIAGGGQPVWWTDPWVSVVPNAAAPPATHVCAIGRHVLANRYDPSGIVQWTPPGDTMEGTWDALDYLEAEARPDRVVAIYDTTNEVFVFGESTLQVMSPDLHAGFVAGRALDLGTPSPYSPIRADGTYAWLDHLHRIVASNGRAYEELSGPALAAVLESLGTVSDGWGFRARMGAFDLLVWVFPTVGRAFCWEQRGKHWSEWRGWSAGQWGPLPIHSHFYWAEKALNLVGMADGTIAKLDMSATTDRGALIHGRLVTGFIDHDISNLKECRRLRLKMRRAPNVTGDPVVELSWRDETTQPFCSPIQFAVVGSGAVLERRSLGMYRQRQWSLDLSGSTRYVIVGAEEHFEPMEN